MRVVTVFAPLLALTLLVSGCGEFEAPETNVPLIEPEFTAGAATPTHGLFGGTVAAKSFPGGVGFAVALPDSRNIIGYSFFLQQEEPLEGLTSQWSNARLIFNRDAILIQDATGNDLIFAVLANPYDDLRQHATINHDEVRAPIRIAGYGLSYNPVITEAITIRDFLSGDWSTRNYRFDGDPTPRQICSNCDCASGGAGSSGCSFGGGGCGVNCQSGYFACCHSSSSCVCCATAMYAYFCEA